MFAGGAQGPSHQPDRRVADPDDPITEHPAHRFGNQAGRIGERQEPGVGCVPGGGLGQVEHDRQGAQPEGQPAGADRLLSQHAAIQCPALVGDPTLGSADPDGREHHVGALERARRVGGQRDGGTGRRAQHRVDRRQPGGIDVVQHDLVDAGVGTGGERPVHQGDPEAAPTEHREPHADDGT